MTTITLVGFPQRNNHGPDQQPNMTHFMAVESPLLRKTTRNPKRLIHQ